MDANIINGSILDAANVKFDENAVNNLAEARANEAAVNGKINPNLYIPRKTKPLVRKFAKVYPNDLCPCGSGKKFKKCCRNTNEDLSSKFDEMK